MESMFNFCIYFNHPIGEWDVSNVIDMSYMFEGFELSTFNQPIEEWDVSNVINMSNMFHDANSLTDLSDSKNIGLHPMLSINFT